MDKNNDIIINDVIYFQEIVTFNYYYTAVDEFNQFCKKG